MEVVEGLYEDVIKEEIRYKRVEEKDLILRVFKPKNATKKERRGAIIFYFGGGFVKENLKHFYMQSEYFAHLGYICFTPNYRVCSNPKVNLEDCYEDAHDAFDYILEHYEQLGIDKDKVILSGGSAGGALAADCALTKQVRGVVLFNPKLYYSQKKSEIVRIEDKYENINGELVKTNAMDEITGCYGSLFKQNPTTFSAYHKCHANQPPILIFQGTYDSIVYSDVILFEERCYELKQSCNVVYYEGQVHGFFNWNRSKDNLYYYDTLKRMEVFVRQCFE